MKQTNLKIFFFSALTFVLSLLSVQAQTQYRGMTINADVKPEELSVLDGWNVNLVRYNIIYGIDADSDTAEKYRTRISASLPLLDKMLLSAQEKGIKVVITLHTPPGSFVTRKGQPLHRIFKEQWAKDLLIETWGLIAKRYAGHPAVYGYDIVNEPAQASVAPGLSSWKELANLLVTEIRKYDTVTPIVVETVYGKPVNLFQISVPNAGSIIYSIHLYYPHKFIHQGIYGIKLGKKYPSKGADRAGLKRHLAKVKTFQKTTNAKIYIGEFSVVRWAPKPSSTKYLSDVLNMMEASGWDWTYHAFRESNVWSLEHSDTKKVLTPVTKETSRLKLMKRFFARNS